MPIQAAVRLAAGNTISERASRITIPGSATSHPESWSGRVRSHSQIVHFIVLIPIRSREYIRRQVDDSTAIGAKQWIVGVGPFS